MGSWALPGSLGSLAPGSPGSSGVDTNRLVAQGFLVGPSRARGLSQGPLGSWVPLAHLGPGTPWVPLGPIGPMWALGAPTLQFSKNMQLSSFLTSMAELNACLTGPKGSLCFWVPLGPSGPWVPRHKRYSPERGTHIP